MLTKKGGEGGKKKKYILCYRIKKVTPKSQKKRKEDNQGRGTEALSHDLMTGQII